MEGINGSIRVHFIDQGIGIPRDHLPHIFDRFYRAGAGEARSGGLGLAIAQAIVRAQGGTIECTTSAGAGSTFAVVLPSREWGELNRN
jgi:signal transduction histidine kinase